MSIDFPDPEKFGEPEAKPHEKIDEEDYHSLEEWGENNASS